MTRSFRYHDTSPPTRTYLQSVLHRAHERRFLFDHEWTELSTNPDFQYDFAATADANNLVQRRQELATVLRFLIEVSQQNGWRWPERAARYRQEKALRQQQTVHN